MASFHDTFTKTEGEKNLQYDNAAFAIFSTALLSSLFVPLLIATLLRLRQRWCVNPRNYHICGCSTCQSRLPQIRRHRSAGTGLGLRLLGLAAVGFLLYKSASAAGAQTLKSFDPYEVMEISIAATPEEVKSQYKRMARRLHPDLNPGDPDAHQKFILLNKAYACLTDEKARAQCEKFGAPDAEGSVEVGIALPSFLLRKENRLVILSLFFILLLVVAPYLAFVLYENSFSVDENGVSARDMPLLFELTRKTNLIPENFIEAAARSHAAARLCRTRAEQQPHLEKLAAAELLPREKLQRLRPYLKPLCVLHAYFRGLPVHESLRAELVELLALSFRQQASLLAMMDQLFALQRESNRRVLRMESVLTALRFSQCLTQGLQLDDSPFMQLPGVDAAALRRLARRADLREVVRSPDARQRFLDSLGDDAGLRREAQAVLEAMPRLSVSVRALCRAEGGAAEERIFVGDIYTIEVEVDRGRDQVGYVHSNRLPLLKRESLHFFLLKAGESVPALHQRLARPERRTTHSYSHPALAPGRLAFRALVLSDSYLGLEEEATLEYEVLPAAQRPAAEHAVHPEDAKALKEPSFLASLLQSGDAAGALDSGDELEDCEPGG